MTPAETELLAALRERIELYQEALGCSSAWSRWREWDRENEAAGERVRRAEAAVAATPPERRIEGEVVEVGEVNDFLIGGRKRLAVVIWLPPESVVAEGDGALVVPGRSS